MERVSLAVPKMYADHHVLAVREILSQVAGIEEVAASAAFKRVIVSFDPAVTSNEVVQEALSQAGYGPDDRIDSFALTASKNDGSFWHTHRPRETQTNLMDLEMSGDFRKY